MSARETRTIFKLRTRLSEKTRLILWRNLEGEIR